MVLEHKKHLLEINVKFIYQIIILINLKPDIAIAKELGDRIQTMGLFLV